MPSVLYLRQFLFQFHFRIKAAVLIHILFVLYFLAIGKLRKCLFMLLLQQCHIIRIFSLYKHFFLCTALFHRMVVVLDKMLVQIRLRLRNQLGNLFLILRFHRFRFIHGSLKLCSPRRLLFLRKAMVPLHSVYFALKRNYLICPILSETVNLFLNFTHIILNWLTQLHFLFRRKGFTIFIIHITISPIIGI